MADKILTRGCMYKLTFPNGKAYIGITTKTAAARYSEHKKEARLGKSKCVVHAAIRKYGAESVTIETLAIAGRQYLLGLEVRAIAAFGTKVPTGYNRTNGGEGVIGCPVSKETREKGRIRMTGTKATDEAREKVRLSKLGKQRPKFSAEWCEKLRAASYRKGPISEEGMARIMAANVGKTVSPETRAKMSAAKKGKPLIAATLAAAKANTGRKMSAECIAKRVATRAKNRLMRGVLNA